MAGSGLILRLPSLLPPGFPAVDLVACGLLIRSPTGSPRGFTAPLRYENAVIPWRPASEVNSGGKSTARLSGTGCGAYSGRMENVAVHLLDCGDGHFLADIQS